MKKFFIIFFILTTILSIDGFAQCRQQDVYKCASKNNKAIYLKDFNAKLRKSKNNSSSGQKWTVTLNRGTKYRFNLCTQNGFEGKVVLTLYDSQHDENNPHGTTFYKGKDKPYFDFVCTRTAPYYLSIKYKPGQGRKRSCAIGVMSFVGKN